MRPQPSAGFPQLEPARVAPGRVAALYDRVAGVYDLWANATEARARERALALAALAQLGFPSEVTLARRGGAGR
jgi:hypothetical protein